MKRHAVAGKKSQNIGTGEQERRLRVAYMMILRTTSSTRQWHKKNFVRAVNHRRFGNA
jgi:hypothetical protein